MQITESDATAHLAGLKVAPSIKKTTTSEVVVGMLLSRCLLQKVTWWYELQRHAVG